MKDNKTSNTEPLAIIGIGCMFPKAGNVKAFWSNIKEGVDAITEIPASHWRPSDYFDDDQSAPDMTYAKTGGFIDSVDFDPLYYGMSPNNIEATDTTQLLGMVATREALLDAGYATANDSHDGKQFDRDRTSVIMGVTGTLELVIPLGARLGHPIWRQALKDAGVDDETTKEVVERISDGYVPWQENSFPGLLGNVAAGRIANRFDLGGTNCVVDAACASSLSAIHMAAMELYAGRADMAITGGLDSFNDIFMYMCFSKTPALSPTGNSRPFQIDGDGTILGEGMGSIILKRLSDAKRDGDKIYALIKGIGSSSDGKGNAIYAPSANGQRKALRNAYQTANVSPGTIELVEAHGTGTRVGDAVEAKALSEIYREDKEEGSWCAMGSVKSMIGHTKAAAGVAGLIKIALALRYKVLPPTLKVDRPLKMLDPGTAPVYVNTVKRPWIKNQDHPRRAAVSAFGFGGSNFHAVLEECAEPECIDWDGRVLMFAYSSDSLSGLISRLDELDIHSDWPLFRKRAAQSLVQYTAGKEFRLILIAEQDKTDMADLISSARDKLSDGSHNTGWTTPDGAFFGRGQATGKLAYLFPGQGAQYTGMLRDLACQFPQVLSVLHQANRIMPVNDEAKRLSDHIYPIPVFNQQDKSALETELRNTAIAQPAIGAMSQSATKILDHFSIKADGCAGHSFGELTALKYARAYDEECFYKLAGKRGQLMQEGEGDRGNMLAVLAEQEKVFKIMEEFKLDLVMANLNAPAQLVLSGASEEIVRAEDVFSNKKIQSHKLSVAAAFHSSFVASAEKPFAEFIASLPFKTPGCPVYSNTTTRLYPDPVKECQALLAGQLAQPVDFVNLIRNMHTDGYRTFLEVGPSNILSGLVSSILGTDKHHVMALDASKGNRTGQYDLACLLAQVSVLGHACQLKNWDAGYLEDLREEPRPAMSVPLNGANYVMPRQKRPPATGPVTPEPVVESTEPGPGDASLLKATQASILALQKMQEQTANLHKQYLQGQEQAQQTLNQLIQQQHQVMSDQGLAAHKTEDHAIEKQEVIETASTPEVSVPVPLPASANQLDYQNILLAVVAEKTGYPEDMLSLDMSLDTDLGIDSIKRVEILSTLQEKLPGMRQIPAEELGTFQLLQHIVEFMAQSDTLSETTVSKVDTTEQLATETSGLQSALLEVVAEKTGYPVDMLNLDMGLDSDLGIDSIKRVEILSALQERLPDMPTVSPEDLGTLQTLQEIMNYMEGHKNETPDVSYTAQPLPLEDMETEQTIYRGVIKPVDIADMDRPKVDLPEGSKIWVTDDGTDLCEKICKSLQKQHFDVSVVQLDKQAEHNIAGLIIVVPEKANSQFVLQAFKQLQQTGPQCKAVAAVTRFGGLFGFEAISTTSPAAAAHLGMIKTADKEWEAVHCKAIDIPAQLNSQKLADAVGREFLIQGPLEVGLYDDKPFGLNLVEQPVATEPGSLFMPEDVIILTGGARGVTAEVAKQFAQSFMPRLVLLGKSPAPAKEPEWLVDLETESEIKKAIISQQVADQQLTPKLVEDEYQKITINREIKKNLDAIQGQGCLAKYYAIDIRHADKVNRLCSEIRKEWGEIKGIVHGAGVLADNVIETKTEGQFNKVYSTKVEGFNNLIAATEKDKLKAIVLFSSSTARFGRKAQVDYAAANEVLNKSAQQIQLRKPACKTLSINWGPWDGGMVTPRLKALFAREGVDVISLKSGSQYLIDELSSHDDQVEIVVLGSRPDSAQITGDKDTKSEQEAFHQVFERRINIEVCPVLKSHVMNGSAVVPAALIIEWLAHGAIHNNPGMEFLGFNDFRILKGVILPARESLDVQILAGKLRIKDGHDYVSVELRSGDIRHARAEIVLAGNYPDSDISIPEHKLEDQPYNEKNLYSNGKLFHGKMLQGIDTITGCSDAGICGTAHSAPAPSNWISQHNRSSWLADPLILDSAFQMLILWSFYSSDNGSLPVHIDHYRQFQRGLPHGAMDIIVTIRNTSAHAITSDIYFKDHSDQVVAVMEGYECVVDTSLKVAFEKNTLGSTESV